MPSSSQRWLSVCVMMMIMITTINAADPHAATRITSLPGLAQLPKFGMFSGYQRIPNTPQNLFYWFIEAEVNPSSAPVLLWLNGGPGCSSLLGFTTENGPFRVAADGTLSRNEYAWNKIANVIFLESPSGVGFSYGTTNNYTTGDNETAINNYAFLVQFFAEYPEYRSNDFFITGESFAGNYIPELAYQIYHGNNGGVNPRINMIGFAVGNPTFDWTIAGQQTWPFLSHHALISMTDLATATTICNGTFSPPPTPQCQAFLDQLQKQMYNINPYNMYAPCVGDGPGSEPGCFTQHVLNRGVGASVAQTFIPCVDIENERNYLRSAAVRAAIHVSPNANLWDACSQVLNYNQYDSNISRYYRTLLPHIRILVYSGDADTCVPYLGTEACVNALNIPVTDPWRTWSIKDDQSRDQVAGKVQSYRDSDTRLLTFATIRGAGHMVPRDKGAESLAMLQRFLSNQPL